jgi:hypothetical protein
MEHFQTSGHAAPRHYWLPVPREDCAAQLAKKLQWWFIKLLSRDKTSSQHFA